MTEDQRAIELEIELPGTPQEVWRAIATGPGISSWYVPHTVEEREGGAALASFGDAPEMQIAGRVAAWDPPHRVVFDGGEGVDGLAFEWLVEARDGATCIVRLVNTGFGSGAEWDDQYDGMAEGWKFFLLNLKLHMTHFAGQTATSMLPMAMWRGPRDETWAALLHALGIAGEPARGERMEVHALGAPELAGTVAERGPTWVAMLLDRPLPGTALVAVEGGDPAGVSIWSYLYGPEARATAERDKTRWQQWLDNRSEGAT